MADRMLTMWLAAWIVAVPLVHVHPEADHQHGETSHVHGGLAHTVFSSDLPCEYQARDGTLSFAGHSAHEFDHPEIGFSLLASAPDRNAGKLIGAELLCELMTIIPLRSSWVRETPVATDSTGSIIIGDCLSPRAPPAAV